MWSRKSNAGSQAVTKFEFEVVVLKDKVAVITGGGSGIGKAIGVLFSRNRAVSIILDKNGDSACAVADEIEREGGKAIALSADVSSFGTVDQAFKEIQKRGFEIDVLVNNAGMDYEGTALNVDERDWENCLDVNLKGAWHCCKCALPSMIAAGTGSIVNIASTHAVRAQSNGFLYSVAKGGLLSLALSIAVDFGRHGVRANTICPGLVFTPMTQAYFDSRPNLSPEELISLQPLAVKIYPEDVAQAALFLSSEMARCVTGTTVFVDGGRTNYLHLRRTHYK